MNIRSNLPKRFGILAFQAVLITGAFFLSSPVRAEKTPTDVYYLALSIDNSLGERFKLAGDFEKERISDTLKPRNVFLKALAVVEEFGDLGIGSIDQARFNAARRTDMSAVKPGNVFNLLNLIRERLMEQDKYSEYDGIREAKTPGDVFQLLRRLSFHNLQIARKNGIPVKWGTPELVYDANMHHILAPLHSIADETRVAYKPFRFPKNALKDIYPRYVYKLQEAVYKNMARHFADKRGYKPIEFLRIKDLDALTPADVLDITGIISAELKALVGDKTLDRENLDKYAEWKRGRQITPGDVIQLVQHNFMISRKINEMK